jgi:hypothetical protein
MTSMRDPVILEAVRTPFGKAGGPSARYAPMLFWHTLSTDSWSGRDWTPQKSRTS